MIDTALLTLRVVFGGLLAGHGSQKLFGWFGGHGKEGTGQWFESMGLKPGHIWTYAAGASELGGGLLTALGFLGPLAPTATLGSMATAALTVHGGKPIWVSSGGAELPVVNMTIASALAMAGPGKYSVDRLIRLRVPRWLAIPGALAGVAGTLYATYLYTQAQQANQQQQQSTEQSAESAAAGV